MPPRRRGAGEGLSSIDYPRDLLHNALDVAQHIIVPEPQHRESQRFQPRGARIIPRDGVQVLRAIDFDDQLPLEAHEIDDVIPDRLLAPEFQATESRGAQMPPQARFRFGGRAAHALGEREECVWHGIIFSMPATKPNRTIPKTGCDFFARSTPLPPSAPAPASRLAGRLAFTGSQLRCSKAPLTPQGEREKHRQQRGQGELPPFSPGYNHRC